MRCDIHSQALLAKRDGGVQRNSSPRTYIRRKDDEGVFRHERSACCRDTNWINAQNYASAMKQDVRVPTISIPFHIELITWVTRFIWTKMKNWLCLGSPMF
ncbi:hypothetical protein ATANTOWER_024961 [Ataeniobius toweri]|uniref:Uncharacterized protein n=1 Tax=Ataeniobius toweri TaxID=208326 RepID=A0ABU7A7Z4_9TELE|nr:hypothetical protein [Ataeniobius toweri]